MGYYIQTKDNHGKAEEIAREHNGKIVDELAAGMAMMDKNKGVIVVCDNGPFEAAGFAYDDDEFKAFTSLTDPRPKKFVVMDRKLAKELSGYRGDQHLIFRTEKQNS